MMQAVKPEASATKALANTSLKKAFATQKRKSGIYNTPFFRPATHINPNNIWLRKMTRIVRHLRDDLQRVHTKVTMPTTWMIKCLLASMSRPEMSEDEFNQFDPSDEQWEKNLRRILQRLLDYSNSAEHIRQSFFELDGFTPLFPNQELFGPQHAHQFAELALNYLDSASNR